MYKINKINYKAQSATEFAILLGAILFIFISLLAVFQQNLSIKAKANRDKEIQEIALQVQNELNIAQDSTNGYQRTFILPNTLINKEYDITLVNNLVYLNTPDGKHALALPVPIVTGTIMKGNNIIKKLNETIFLNT
jgi:hypothetical protein